VKARELKGKGEVMTRVVVGAREQLTRYAEVL
jgi:hypothetical protein